MIIIIGLVILIAAVIAGLAGVLSNSGSGHPLTHHFAVFGYHVTGSTGTLFLYGIVVGALGLLGLSLLLAGARRTSRRGREARHRLIRSRRETATVSQDRDNLLDQRETARARAAGNAPAGNDPGDGPAGNDPAGNDPGGNDPAGNNPGGNDPGRDGREPAEDAVGARRSRWHLFEPRSASAQAAAPSVPTVNGHGPDVPADASATQD
jgi:hypothetical protein